MQYELYLDVQILTDLAMNLVLLFLTGKMLRLSLQIRRLLTAAFTGALVHTAVLVAAVQIGHTALAVMRTGQIVLALIAPAAAVLMIRITFSLREWKLLVKSTGMFYMIAFAFAGAMQYVNPLQRKTLTAFVLTAAAGYGGITFLLWLYRRWKREQGHLYPVRIYIGEEMYQVTGLVDTGNRLMDPWYHRPVNIIEQSVLKDFKEEALKELKLHMIPYNSIGKQNGILMGIIIPRMVIEGEKGEQTVKEAVLALNKGKVSSDGRYQMILHEECLHD